MKIKLFILIWILILAGMTGCSGGGRNPVMSSDDYGNYPQLKPENASPSLIVSDVDENGYPTGGVATMGMYHGTLNLKTLEASLSPLRQTSELNDSLVIDITNFLTISPCTTCVKLKSVSMNADNYPVMRIGIRHPFAPGSQSSPPSATNRLDLHVFTVRGFIVADGIVGGGAKIFSGLDQEIPAWRLVNASGYSSEFDEKWDMVFETRPTLHPYVLHFDDYSYGNYSGSNVNGFQNPALPTGNLVMWMGADFDYKDYVVKFPPSDTEVFEFLYAITVSYGMSAKGKVQWLNPVYKVPLYCGKPASLVRVKTIDDKLDDVDSTSYADITLEVLDINHQTPVGDAKDQMDYDSSIKSISIEVPEMKNDPFIFEGTNLVSIGGSQRNSMDPLKFKLRIYNEKIMGVGKYIGLIKVLDAYPADANENLGGNNAIPAVAPYVDPTTQMFKINEWATYTVFEYSVFTGNRPPVCEVGLVENEIFGGSTAKAYPGPGTGDPDGNIILYEYDMDYDGEIFNVDASNTNGNQVDLGPYVNESGANKVFTIALRVTDDAVPGKNSICTKNLIVHHFSPVIFSDNFDDNIKNWTFDSEKFWGIKDGFLASAGGLGADSYGLGCYADDLGPNERFATSAVINVPALPAGYATIRLTIVHAVDTEVFPFNPFDFTDDCDVWIKPSDTDTYKMMSTGGQYYNTNFMTSRDGPSFADKLGIDPAFGETFEGVATYFDDSSLAGKSIRLKFRQETDDGIDNCRGGWWIDSMKLEFLR